MRIAVSGGIAVRWRAHDTVVFNAHTSRPDHGEFLHYSKEHPGWCRVSLWRAGRKTVPIKSITRPERVEVGK